MPRPSQGGSNGTWGTELDAWLDVAHNADGTLLSSAVQTALGGSLPDIVSAVTRDSQNRVTGFTDSSGTYTVTYDVSTGLAKTVGNGTTTRTISRDSSGLVTGVA